MYIHILLLLLVNHVASDSLYESSDPILELDTDTFDAAVYNTKKAHFVEFYSSWCGACIGYAPTFKKFARQVQSWSPVVQITVLNCADDKNTKICREHQVNSYPLLKYFKYDSKSKNDGLVYKGDKYDIEKLATDIAGLVQADYQNQKPEGWPSFTPFAEHSTVDNVMSSFGSAPFLAVIIQDNPAVLAWANLINFHGSKVSVVSVPPSHPIVAHYFGSAVTIGALLFGVGNTQPLWKEKDVTSWIQVQEKIDSVISEKLPEYVGRAPPTNTETKAAEFEKRNQFELQLVDLQSAISYMLYKEIPRRETIEDEPLAALKHWMTTLKKYAPGTTPMRRLFYRLDEWLQVKSSVTADEWTAEIDRIQQDLGNPIPKEITWMACAGSKPNLRGYTCGLWTLAHTVTVEAYNQEKDNASFKPVIDVLEPFRAFIFYFLSCSECAQNFTKEAEKNHLQLVTRPQDVYAWLWKVHNFVNKRLSGSLSDDPHYPKQQFPSKTICPECYNPSGEFDEEKTLDFVYRYYSNIKQDPVKPAPGYKVVEYKNGKTVAAGQRHLNPKFQIHGSKVDKLEENEKARNKLDASPHRNWRELDDEYPKTPQKSHLYLIWLSLIGVALIIVYCKYRRNRSKFWKTFYYTNDFKL